MEDKRKLTMYAGHPFVVYNPHGRELGELPTIFMFANSSGPGWISAVSLAENGVALGGHGCSSEFYVPYDLGAIGGYRADRHANDYETFYRNGYACEYIPQDQIMKHERLMSLVSNVNGAKFVGHGWLNCDVMIGGVPHRKNDVLVFDEIGVDGWYRVAGVEGRISADVIGEVRNLTKEILNG